MAKKYVTLEPWAYLQGVYDEFTGQRERHSGLIAHLMEVQAKVELSEKNLTTTRDHLAALLENAEVPTPKEWTEALAGVRFVGSRLADACVAVLREHRRLTFEQLLGKLNFGGYRFRTTSPLREIHAAVLRHPHIKRDGELWTWAGPEKDRLQKLLLLKRALTPEPRAEDSVEG